MLFLFRCTLHLEHAREYLPPGHQTPNRGLMKEFYAGDLQSACHEKSFSRFRNAPNAMNRPFSPDSGRTVSAFRILLEIGNCQPAIAVFSRRASGTAIAFADQDKATSSAEHGLVGAQDRFSTLPVSGRSIIRSSCETYACPFPPLCSAVML